MSLAGARFSLAVIRAVNGKKKQNEIKSYVLRQGRITKGQVRALEAGWSHYGLNSAQGVLELETTFGRTAETVLEVGFGMGDSLAVQAMLTPEKNFIGVEVHKAGVGHLLMKALQENLSNLRVYNEDSRMVLANSIPEKSLQAVQIFFPDPWPKKRHHKRRLLGPSFLDLVASKLKQGGLFHIATDWKPYAEEVELLFTLRPDFESVEIPQRPETKFERRARKVGYQVLDMAYRLKQ